MPNPDGSIVFSTEIDNKKAQAELEKLEKKISALESKASQAEAKKIPLEEQANSLGAALDDAKQKLEALKSSSASSGAISNQAETVNSLQYQWDQVNNKIDKYNRDIEKANGDIGIAKDRAGELAAELATAGHNSEKMNNGVKKAAKSAKGFASRLKSVVRSALVFTVITQALSKFRDWIGNVIKVSPEATAAIAKLKGALLTLVQPLVNIIIPAFTKFVNILAAIISKIASVFAVLTGSTVESSRAAAKALNQQTSALNGTGAAAKEAKKQLLGFDEINQLTENTSGGGGGSGTIAPDFSAQEFDSTFLDTILEKVGKIAADVLAIIEDVRDFVTDFLSGEWGDAIDDLVSFCWNVRNLIVDLYEFVDYIVGNGIDSIIEKFGLAETPIGDMLESIKGMFHDATEFIVALLNGDIEGMKESLDSFFEHFKNFGSALLDFANQGINSLLDWIDKATNGRFKNVIATIKQFVSGMIDSVKQILGGLIDFISGVFTGDWEKAWEGIKNFFKGIWNGIVSILEGAVNLIINGINWMIRQLNKIQINAPDWLGGGTIGFNIPSISTVSIPRLAQGAVIPPNREFMAVLGDQTHGTNIEAPADLIRQIVREELSRNGGLDVSVSFDGDMAQFIRMLTPKITAQQRKTSRALGG